jgi:glycosyltransferase involved in cell wall biosynthesis
MDAQSAPKAAGAGPAKRPIQIALATCDGEKYLPALLDSLFGQTRQDFTILVGDDASRDASVEIVEAYASRYPGRIEQLAGEGPRRGVIANFDRLLASATADYVFLCDHDDVWLSNKIELSLAAMQALEAQHDAGTPLLVHTDLVVVGPDLEVLSDSFFEYSSIDPGRNDVVQLLLANVVSGCTALINRALYLRARPIPAEAMMYDHWLALVAATTGAITYVDTPTILYRQHGRNVIGARQSRRRLLVQRVYGTLVSRERERVLRRYSRQAAILLERFGTSMRGHDRLAAETLAFLWEKPRLRRFASLRRCNLGLEGMLRNIALFVVTARASREKGRGADHRDIPKDDSRRRERRG